jgi:quercetin dioxygenase-like cupin family protein
MTEAKPGKETTTRGGDERETRPLAAPLSVVRIEDAAERLRSEAQYRLGDRNAVTLTKDGSMRVQLVTLNRRARLQENDPEGSLSAHVLEGSVTVTVEGRSEHVTSGSVALVAAGHRWEISADEESLLLVQLSWPPEPASR